MLGARRLRASSRLLSILQSATAFFDVSASRWPGQAAVATYFIILQTQAGYALDGDIARFRSHAKFAQARESPDSVSRVTPNCAATKRLSYGSRNRHCSLSGGQRERMKRANRSSAFPGP